MTAVVTARRDARYLIDLGDGRGMIYDADEDILYPPKGVLTLSAQPYWGDPGDLPANVRQVLDDLNAPSESTSAMAETQTARDDVSAVAFDTAFKNWFHNESDPLAVMMGMKQPDKPMPKPPTVSATPIPKAKIDPKTARRFVWLPGDMTITNPDGTVVTP